MFGALEHNRPITQFCLLWATVEFFDLICFPKWVNEPTGILLFLATMAAILKPSSSPRFLILCVLDPAYLWVISPITPNHTLFKGFVCLTILLVSLRHFRLPLADARVAVFDEAAALLRVETLILYFFAVFHKLNWDFFSPVPSCAGFLLDGIVERVPFFPIPPFLRSASIWATFLFEGGIPLLVLWPRTRLLGLWAAWAFHLFLAFHPRTGIYALSHMLYVLLSLFLPATFYPTLQSRLEQRGILARLEPLTRITRLLPAILLAGTALATAIALAIRFGGLNLRGRDLSYYPEVTGMFLWFATAILFAAALYLAWDYAAPKPLPNLFRPAWQTPVAIIVLLLTLNGFAPYLGFQTVRVISMFSNLHTEDGVSNHLVMPASLQIASYQRDLIVIESSTDPWLNYLATSRYLTPFAELQRRFWEDSRPLRVTFRRHGQSITISRGDPHAREIIPPLPFPLHKILAFREIVPAGPTPCFW